MVLSLTSCMRSLFSALSSFDRWGQCYLHHRGLRRSNIKIYAKSIVLRPWLLKVWTSVRSAAVSITPGDVRNAEPQALPRNSSIRISAGGGKAGIPVSIKVWQVLI